MNHAPGAGSLTRPVDRQSSSLARYHWATDAPGSTDEGLNCLKAPKYQIDKSKRKAAIFLESSARRFGNAHVHTIFQFMSLTRSAYRNQLYVLKFSCLFLFICADTPNTSLIEPTCPVCSQFNDFNSQLHRRHSWPETNILNWIYYASSSFRQRLLFLFIDIGLI